MGLYVPRRHGYSPFNSNDVKHSCYACGCSTKILATPPNQDGKVPNEIAYIAQKAKISNILLAGGAQAVAAMAWVRNPCLK